MARKKAKRRFVFDTNVLISGVLTPNGEAHEAFRRANREGYFLLSDETFAELREVLYRPAFDLYLTQRERRRFMLHLLSKSVRISIEGKLAVCQDPDDDRLLEVAVSGKAECVVTRNLQDFPAERFRDVLILTPGQFLKQERR